LAHVVASEPSCGAIASPSRSDRPVTIRSQPSKGSTLAYHQAGCTRIANPAPFLAQCTPLAARAPSMGASLWLRAIARSPRGRAPKPSLRWSTRPASDSAGGLLGPPAQWYGLDGSR